MEINVGSTTLGTTSVSEGSLLHCLDRSEFVPALHARVTAVHGAVPPLVDTQGVIGSSADGLLFQLHGWDVAWEHFGFIDHLDDLFFRVVITIALRLDFPHFVIFITMTRAEGDNNSS